MPELDPTRSVCALGLRELSDLDEALSQVLPRLPERDRAAVRGVLIGAQWRPTVLNAETRKNASVRLSLIVHDDVEKTA